jgi:hypothetical protein
MMYMWIAQHRAGKRQNEEDDVALLHGCPATDPEGLTTILALGTYLQFCIALDTRHLDPNDSVPAMEVAEHQHFLKHYRKFKEEFAHNYYLAMKAECCDKGKCVSALFKKDVGSVASTSFWIFSIFEITLDHVT